MQEDSHKRALKRFDGGRGGRGGGVINLQFRLKNKWRIRVELNESPGDIFHFVAVSSSTEHNSFYLKLLPVGPYLRPPLIVILLAKTSRLTLSFLTALLLKPPIRR